MLVMILEDVDIQAKPRGNLSLFICFSPYQIFYNNFEGDVDIDKIRYKNLKRKSISIS